MTTAITALNAHASALIATIKAVGRRCSQAVVRHHIPLLGTGLFGVAGIACWLLGYPDAAIALLVGALIVTLALQFFRSRMPMPRDADHMAIYKGMFETNPAGIFVFSSDGLLRSYNDRAMAMIVNSGSSLAPGMTYEDFCRQLAASGVIPAARHDPEVWLGQRLREFGVAEHQQELRLANGLWCRVSQRRLPDGHVALIVIDTSQEHQREQAIRQQEEFYRELAGLTSDWIWETDAEHRFTELDNSFGQSWPNPLKNYVGRTRREIAAPDDLQNESDKWDRHQIDLDTHKPFRDIDYAVCETTNELVRRVRSSGRPRFDKNGKFIGYRGVASDITAESEQRHRADVAHQRLVDALEAIPVAVAIYDSQGRLRHCSSSYRTMLQPITEHLIPGMARRDLIDLGCKLGIKVNALDGAGIATGKALVGTQQPYELLLPDGRCFQIRERATADGDLIVSGNDVTALKRQTWELAEKSKVLQGTLDNIQQGLVVFAADYRLIAWNDQFLTLLEADGVEVEFGQSMQDVVRRLAAAGAYPNASSEEDVERICKSTMACDPPQLTVATPTGGSLDIRHSPMPDGGVAITLTDISALKQRERELEQKSEELEVVFETMEYGITVIDPDMTITAMNDRMISLLELPPDDVGQYIGCRLVDMVTMLARTDYYGRIIPEEEIDAFVANQLLDMAPLVPIVRERRLPSGTVLDYRVSPIKGAGWLVTCRDITRERRAEEALREAKEQAELANRAKTEFLANTSHELRTPLNAIIGFSEILMKEMFGPLGSQRYVDYVTDINDSGQHLLDIINDLLDLAKVEAGHLDLHEEPVVVKDLIEASLRLVRERAQTNRILLRTELAECLASVFVDERAIKQVLINLLSNAVKFTPEGGQVSISADAAADGSIEFRVVDTGIGMAAEDIPKALTPFGQIDGSMSRRYHGTGLGLPLASRLAELHGGSLTVKSDLGKGTTVTVHLPASRHVQHVGRQIAAHI